MNAYDAINELNDFAADLNDIRERIHTLGRKRSLHADIDTPLYQAIYQIEQAIDHQQMLAQDEPKSDFELGLERLAEKRSMSKVEVIDYAKRLAEMQGGTAV